MAKANKGANFERTQCRDWSRWFTSGKSEDVFWRTEGSGGRAKSRAKKIIKKDPAAAESLLKYSYGDMSFQLPIGESLIQAFLFEFKRGYSAGRQLDVNSLRDTVKEIGRAKASKPTKKWIEKYVRKIRSLLAKTRKTPAVDILDFVDGCEKKNEPMLLQWFRNAVNECVQAKRSQVILVLKRDGKDPTVFVQEDFGRLIFKSFDSQQTNYGTLVCGPFNLMYFSQKDLFKHVTPEKLIQIAAKRKVSRKIRRRK